MKDSSGQKCGQQHHNLLHGSTHGYICMFVGLKGLNQNSSEEQIFPYRPPPSKNAPLSSYRPPINNNEVETEKRNAATERVGHW